MNYSLMGYIPNKYMDNKELKDPYYRWWKKDPDIKNMFVTVYEKVSLYLTHWNYDNYLKLNELIVHYPRNDDIDTYSHDYCVTMTMRILGFEHWNLYYFYNMPDKEMYDILDKKMEYGLKKLRYEKKLQEINEDF